MEALSAIVAAVAWIAVLSIAWDNDSELCARQAFARIISQREDG